VIKVPAVMACVPSTKTNVAPPPPGGGGSGTPHGFFCYKVKCPTTTLPALPGTDQFGSRAVTPRVAKLLCAPLEGPSTTTTLSSMTTTTSGTTTTTVRFVDNGDGTITDHQTGLQWEQKVAGSGCLHCVDDTYTWSASGTGPDGTVFTSFLDTLNGGATGVGDCVADVGPGPITGGFNGHCDWRLPTIVELQTILNLSGPGTPDFGPVPSAVALTGARYWSSTSWSAFRDFVWYVDFWPLDATLNAEVNVDGEYVRAVRGGL
jgi:uncharacterized protein DUF1566